MTKRKILTVVLLSGCGSTAVSKSQTPTPSPTPVARTAEVPVTEVAGTTYVAAPPVFAMPTTTPPPIAPDDQQPMWRLELRATLYSSESKPAKMERFRALCDADGYPLVGNVSSKNMKYEVADYCNDVRSAALRQI